MLLSSYRGRWSYRVIEAGDPIELSEGDDPIGLKTIGLFEGFFFGVVDFFLGGGVQSLHLLDLIGGGCR